MKLLLSVFISALYGLTMRFLFGIFDGQLGVMSLSFFFLLPFIIGFLTIYILPYKAHHTRTGAFFKPWLTCIVLVAVTMYLDVEGSICWFLAFPIIAICAGIGGIVAFNWKSQHVSGKEEPKDDWDKPGSLKLSVVLMVPVFAGFAEGDRSTSFEELTVQKQVVINASPQVVWNTLLASNRAHITSHHITLSNTLGFPHHLNTVMYNPAVGGLRVATYEKGLIFTETITRLEPRQSMAVNITTDPSQISKAIMDEHIVIGGKHIKMLEDQYTLKELPGGKTQLTLSSRFGINTPFNWYAGLWAKWLMGDILEEEVGALG